MKDEVIHLSRRLVSIASTKDNSFFLANVINEASKELTDYTLKSFTKNNHPSVLYYNTAKIPKKFKVILNAHLDVVPANVEQFKSVIKGDKLYGRGAQDMKGAAAVEILVFKELAHKLKYPLGLQLVTDEEVGGFDGTKHQVENGIRADFVISGESTNLKVGHMAKGIIWAKIIAKGSSAHGAYLWNGVNSAKVLTNALNTIWKTFPIPAKEQWITTVNVGRVITTNESFNKVPDHSEAWLDIRYIPEDKEKVLQKIKSILPKEVSFEKILYEPEHFTAKNNLYIKALLEAGKMVLGKKPDVVVRHGASDVRHFSKVKGDGVEFGPIGKGLHSDNEWVSITSLEKYYNILKQFLLSL